MSEQIKTPERHVVFESFDQMLAEMPGLALLVENAGRSQSAERFCAQVPAVEQKEDGRPDTLPTHTAPPDEFSSNDKCRDNVPNVGSVSRPVDVEWHTDDTDLSALRDSSVLLRDQQYEQYSVCEQCELSDCGRELVSLSVSNSINDYPDKSGDFGHL
jgi:hypothetical protein